MAAVLNLVESKSEINPCTRDGSIYVLPIIQEDYRKLTSRYDENCVDREDLMQRTGRVKPSRLFAAELPRFRLGSLSLWLKEALGQLFNRKKLRYWYVCFFGRNTHNQAA